MTNADYELMQLAVDAHPNGITTYQVFRAKRPASLQPWKLAPGIYAALQALAGRGLLNEVLKGEPFMHRFLPTRRGTRETASARERRQSLPNTFPRITCQEDPRPRRR